MTQNQQPTTFRVAVIPVTGFQQNCSIVYDDKSKLGAVVDPGGDVGVIMEAIAKMGVSIQKILLTHGHLDHAGGEPAGVRHDDRAVPSGRGPAYRSHRSFGVAPPDGRLARRDDAGRDRAHVPSGEAS